MTPYCLPRTTSKIDLLEMMTDYDVPIGQRLAAYEKYTEIETRPENKEQAKAYAGTVLAGSQD